MDGAQLKTAILLIGPPALYWGAILCVPFLFSRRNGKPLPNWSARWVQLSLFVVATTALLNGQYVIALLFPPIYMVTGIFYIFAFAAKSPYLMLVVLSCSAAGFAITAYVLAKRVRRWTLLLALLVGLLAGVGGGDLYTRQVMGKSATKPGVSCYTSLSLLTSLRQYSQPLNRQNHALFLLDNRIYRWSYAQMAFVDPEDEVRGENQRFGAFLRCVRDERAATTQPDPSENP